MPKPYLSIPALETLDFLIDFNYDEGFYPTTDEIATHFKIAKHVAYERLLRLEREGFIVRHRKNGRAISRAIKITDKWMELNK